MYGLVTLWLAGMKLWDAEMSMMSVYDAGETSFAEADRHCVPLWKWHCGRPYP